MRVLLGLAALAAPVFGQVTVVPTTGGASNAIVPSLGSQQTAFAAIKVTQTNNNLINGITPAGLINSNNYLTVTQNYLVPLANTITTIVFAVSTNQYTGQMQYKWSPNYSPGSSFTCDPCAGGTTTSCNTAGPIQFYPGNGAVIPTSGYPCALLTRFYTMSNIPVTPTGVTYGATFQVQVFDLQNAGTGALTSSASFYMNRAPAAIIGDPQISGMQGQDFQVHGMPDEIFNMITYPNLQVNARFVYLSSGACHDNFTACFAHPGTYISEEGIRLGSDKIHVQAGSFKKGLTVSVNGKKVTEKKTSVKLGSVELVNHRRVIVKTPIMSIAISNSDKFLNQETALFDQKLLSLGSERQVLADGENFHSEVPLHGLQGQTWRNVEYPSGLEYEGSISDYHVTSGNIYGTEFTFNQFKQ